MDTLHALLRLQTLDDLPRTGWVQHGVPLPESVGAHSLGTAFVVLALGARVEPKLDVDRAVSLALVHDVGEVHIGDIPRSGAGFFPDGAKAAAERAAADDCLAPVSSLARERAREALARESREARFVHLCDRLQLGVRWVAYVTAGHAGLGQFRAGLETLDCDEFPVCAELRREILTAVDAIR